MKVLASTHTRLTLEHRPFKPWVAGAFYIALGLGCTMYTAFSSAAAQLTCDRPAPHQIHCELKRTNLLGATTEKLNLSNPYNAYLGRKMTSKGGTSYQVIVSTFGEDVPLLYQGNGNAYTQEKIVSQIKDFLANGQSALVVQQDVRFGYALLSLLGLAATAAGTYLAMTPITTCTFYRHVMNKVVIERKGWRGNLMLEYPIDQIQRVEIEAGQERYGKAYRAVLVLKNQQRLPVNWEFTDEPSVRSAMLSINLFLELKNKFL